MACGSCGGGRSSGSSYVNAHGVAETFRLTHTDGAQVYYTDGDRAKGDRDQLAGSKLEVVNPVTGAVISEVS